MKREAEPYAMALLELAQAADKEELFENQLFEISKTVEDNRDLRLLLEHPQVDWQTKSDLLKSLFQEEMDPTILDFIQVICQRQAAGSLKDVAPLYKKLYEEAQNIKAVHVTSASPLDDKQVQALKDMLEKKLQGKVRMDIQVDPALIAGLSIQGDGFSLDNSFAGRLAGLRDILKRH